MQTVQDRVPMTDKQQEIYDFLKARIREKGYPPSVREIGEAVHLRSTSSVHAQLETLERKGYIRKDATKPRAIEIMDDTFYGSRNETVAIPIIGNVAAGEPIFADQNVESYFTLNAEFIPNGANVFMLHVHGESMINIGIFNGDMVLVREQDTANDGDVVVALVGDSATVKTFYKEDGYYRLQPENDTMEPIIVKEAQILGKVIGIYRRLE